MPSQFEVLDEKLEHLEKLVMQVIHMLGPRIDQDALREGLQLEVDEPLDLYTPAEGEDPRPQPTRTKVPYKNLKGEWDELDINLLRDEVRAVYEIAIQLSDPWQLWETPTGDVNIAVSNEVIARYHASLNEQ